MSVSVGSLISDWRRSKPPPKKRIFNVIARDCAALFHRRTRHRWLSMMLNRSRRPCGINNANNQRPQPTTVQMTMMTMMRSITAAFLSVSCLSLPTTLAFVAPSPRTAARMVTGVPNRNGFGQLHQQQQHQTQLQLVVPGLEDIASSMLVSADPGEFTSTYSRASYYTVLGLYAMSFPGVWSAVKRSTKAKIKKKTYISAGENANDGKGLRQQAGEIMACECNVKQVVEASMHVCPFVCLWMLGLNKNGRCYSLNSDCRAAFSLCTPLFIYAIFRHEGQQLRSPRSRRDHHLPWIGAT